MTAPDLICYAQALVNRDTTLSPSVICSSVTQRWSSNHGVAAGYMGRRSSAGIRTRV